MTLITAFNSSKQAFRKGFDSNAQLARKISKRYTRENPIKRDDHYSGSFTIQGNAVNRLYLSGPLGVSVVRCVPTLATL